MSGSILNVAFYAFFQQPSGCSGLEWGCCADGATDRTDRHGGGCAGVVPSPPLATLSNSSSGGGLGFSSRSSYGSYSGSCQQGLDASGFGCCGNGLTTRVDEAGTNCFGVTRSQDGAASFLLFFAVGLPALALAMAAGAHEASRSGVVPPAPPGGADPARRRFEYGFLLVLCVGVVLLVANVLSISQPFSRGAWQLVAAATLLLVCGIAGLLRGTGPLKASTAELAAARLLRGGGGAGPEPEDSDCDRGDCDRGSDPLLLSGGGNDDSDSGGGGGGDDGNLTPGQVLRTKEAWLIFFGMFNGMGGGLMVLNNASQMFAARNASAGEAAVAVSLCSVMNAFGRMSGGVSTCMQGLRCATRCATTPRRPFSSCSAALAARLTRATACSAGSAPLPPPSVRFRPFAAPAAAALLPDGGVRPHGRRPPAVPAARGRRRALPWHLPRGLCLRHDVGAGAHSDQGGLRGAVLRVQLQHDAGGAHAR
jgi:hypothetical protein